MPVIGKAGGESRIEALNESVCFYNQTGEQIDIFEASFGTGRVKVR